MLDPMFLLSVGFVLLWTFWSGFSDASNAITTVVATRVLRPWQAVVLAAMGNLVGIFLGNAVAETMGRGLVDPAVMSGTLVVSAIAGGMVWEYITYRRGIPISETQVLIGAIAGAAVAAGGTGAVKIGSIVSNILVPMGLAPIIAFVAVVAFTGAMLRLVNRVPRHALNGYFRKLQLLSSAFFSITHGANDGQKSTGVLLAIFIFYGMHGGGETVPLWLTLAVFLALSLGTLFGGWRIVKTMGFKLARMQPWQGFAAETSAALVVGGASLAGYPLSTSQTVSGSIMGVGAARGKHAMNLGVVREILGGWLLTIPVSFVLGYVGYSIISALL